MGKTPLIIDCDPGIDDALAIAIASYSPEVDVKLITTVAGNVAIEHTTQNALRLVTFFEKRIPVAEGAPEPLQKALEDASNVHGVTGMEGFDFPDPNQSLLLNEGAVEALYKTLSDSNEPITLMCIGPLTNIALLFKIHPEVKPCIKEIIMMGGSLTRGNKGVMAEFNIYVDPDAAKIVFGAGVPLTVLPLDVGLKALVMPEDSEKLLCMGRVGVMAHDLFKKYRGGSFNTGLKMYDPTAVAALLEPSLFTFVETFGDVETTGELTNGCTVFDLKGYLGKPANLRVATDVDSDGFRKWFLDGVSRCI